MKRSTLSIVTLTLCLILPFLGISQQKQFFDPLQSAHVHSHEQCGFDYMKEATVRKGGDTRPLHEIQEERLQKILDARGQSNRAGGNGQTDCQDYYRIPVVWYVVHNGAQGFVSEQRILANMNVLNSHYAGSGIEFCLATQYNGGSIPTPALGSGVTNVVQSGSNPGIMWVDHPYLASTYQGGTSPQHPILTGLSVLPEDRYLRIFVVPDAHNGAGWTYLPGWAAPGEDGIFMSHYTIGDFNTCNGICQPGYEYGHVLTHETGHYLNLLHIFEGGCSGGLASDCKTSGDQVCDTPPTTGGGGTNCVGPINTCTNDVPDLPDLTNNHMDYWSDVCRTDFTQGQFFRQRMAAYTYRSLMVSDANQQYTGTQCPDQNWNCDLNPDYSWAPDADDCTINFTDLTAPGGSGFIGCYLWDFGDGSTSNEQNPSHSYIQAGTYNVCLTVTGYDPVTQNYCECSICYDITVTCTNPPCAATACITPTLIGPLQYSFDPSCSTANGTVTYLWDFGDGSPTSTATNPTHTYTNNGSYFVSLTITNTVNGVSCSHQTWYWLTVSQPCAPTASFTHNVGGECQIIFNNNSTPGWPYMVTAVTWDFGDGNTANVYSPSHTYLNPGTYTVCLTITVSDGVTTCTDTFCDQVTVNCSGDGCYAEPDFTTTDLGSCKYEFTDNSILQNNTQIIQWDWTFGDGSTDTGQTVIHQYTSNGVYQVCLTITCVDVLGNFCTFTYCELITINCMNSTCSPNPQFTITQGIGCCWDFAATDPTSIDPGCSTWTITDFGGITVDSGTGFSHTFCPTVDGTYTICFEACCVNSDGTTVTQMLCQTIDVDCFCIPDAGFQMIEGDTCCYEFVSNVQDPDLENCSNWVISDTMGNIILQATSTNLIHCFEESGSYIICHEQCCYNADGSVNIDLVCHTLDVECGCPEPCEIDPRFIWDMYPITQANGCCMDFYDLTVAGNFTSITGYFWDFGDGNTSTSANPTHCYQDPGTYTVCLTVTGLSPEGQCDETFCWEVICDCQDTCPGDLNGDGLVNLSDLLIFLGQYNQVCP